MRPNDRRESKLNSVSCRVLTRYFSLAWVQELIRQDLCQVELIKSVTGISTFIGSVIRCSNRDVKIVHPSYVCVEIQSKREYKTVIVLK